MNIDKNNEFFKKLEKPKKEDLINNILEKDEKTDLINSYDLLMSISTNCNSKLFWLPIMEIMLHNKTNKNILFADQVSAIRKDTDIYPYTEEYNTLTFSEIIRLFQADDFILKCKYVGQSRKNFLKNRSFLGIGKNINENKYF